MNLSEFENFLKSEAALPHCLLLESADSYSTQHTLGELRRYLFQTDDAAIIASRCQEESFRASDLGNQVVTTVLMALQTLPMFTPVKLVVLRELDELESQQEEQLLAEVTKLKASETKARQGVYILLQVPKLRANAKIKKFFEKSGLYINATVENKPAFEVAMKMMAERRGLKLTSEIIRFLSEYLPIDLTRADQEVEKLSLFAGKNGTIDLNNASELICSTNLENVFRMTDAIGERDSKKAVEILLAMLSRGESPQMLLAMLGRHMRHLYRVKMVEQQRISREFVGEALETQSSFVINKAIQQARSFSLNGLRGAVQRLFEVDCQLKSTSVSAEMLMEKLVVEFCRLPKAQVGSASRAAY
jgi:DNA polymerase-3 subunit delta